MYRVWYWAIDRENDGRFIASIPDLGELAAYGHSDKDAVAHVTELANQHVRASIDDGRPVPPRRHFSEMPSHIRSKGGRARDDSRWRSSAGKRGQLRPITCPHKMARHGAAFPEEIMSNACQSKPGQAGRKSKYIAHQACRQHARQGVVSRNPGYQGGWFYQL